MIYHEISDVLKLFLSLRLGHSGFARDKRYRGSLRGDDEYRRKYAKIKNELEVERIKSRQLQQERVEEMRRLREAFESDRKLEIASLQNKLEEERKKEVIVIVLCLWNPLQERRKNSRLNSFQRSER